MRDKERAVWLSPYLFCLTMTFLMMGEATYILSDKLQGDNRE